MASEVGSAFVSLLPSLRGFSNRVRRELRSALAGVSGEVKLDPNVDQRQAATAGRQASATAQAAARPVRIGVEVDRSALRRLLPSLASTGKALAVVTVGLAGIGAVGSAASAALAGLTSAAAGLIPVIGQLAAVLASASGLLLALPAAIAIAGAAGATLAVGLRGVGDAFKAAADGGEEYAEALQNLAPAAANFVTTLVAMRPAFKDLRLAVQQRLFAGMAHEVQQLAEAQLPGLQRGLVRIAEVLNGAILDGLRTLATDRSVRDLSFIFDSARISLENMRGVVSPLLRALLDVTAVGSSFVAQLTGGLGPAAERLADFVRELRNSGRLFELMENGLAAVKELGAALADIGGIIAGIFRAAGGASGGIFGFLHQLNELVNSFAGQRALADFFSELSRIGAALQPVLLALVRGLGTVASAVGDIAEQTAPFLSSFLGSLATALASLAPGFIALGPSVAALGAALVPVGKILSDLVVGIAPGVQTFITALGEGLGHLAPAAGLVGEALGQVLEAVAPLLPLIGASLANVLTVLATILTGLVNGPGAVFIDLLSQIFTQLHTALTPVLTQLASQLMPLFATAAQRILDAFLPLVPVIGQVATIFADELAAILPDLVDVFGQLLLAFADMAGPIGQALLTLLLGLVPQMPALAEAGLALAEAFTEALVALAPLLPDLARMLALVLRLVTPTVLAALIRLVRGATIAFTAMARGAQRIIGPMVRGIQVVSRFRNTVSDRLRAVRQLFNGLPGRIRSAIGNLGRLLINAGRQVVGGLLQGIRDRFADVRSTLSNLTSLLPSWKGPLDKDRRILRPAGQAIMQGLRRGFVDEIPRVESTLRGVTTDLAAAGMPAGEGAEPAARVFVDGTGLPRALDEWLRHAVRVRGGGNVQRWGGQRAAAAT